MKAGLRFQVLVSAAAALAMSVMAGSAVSETAPQSLASPGSFAAIADAEARSAAMFTELGKVLTHPRCTNCHPASDRPNQTDGGRPHRLGVGAGLRPQRRARNAEGRGRARRGLVKTGAACPAK